MDYIGGRREMLMITLEMPLIVSIVTIGDAINC